MKKVRVTVSSNQTEAVGLLRLLEEEGGTDVETVEQRGLAQETLLIAGMFAVSSIAALIVRLIRALSTGVIVTVGSDGTVATEQDMALPKGSVVVIRPDDKHVELKEAPGIQLKELIDSLIRRGGG